VTTAQAQPYVLIIEGLISPPIAYRPLRQRLLDRGAAGVDLAPVHIHDWMRAGMTDFGALHARVATAIRRAYEHAGARPILIVGHSGGGVLARLAMSDTPYRGRLADVAGMVGCLVTLGTPHDLHLTDARWRHPGVDLCRFLAEHQPGARYAPATTYLTVASDAVRPRPRAVRRRTRNPVKLARNWFFRAVVGTPDPAGSDGVVSAAIAHLEGARQVTFHDVVHGVLGGPWYGDTVAVDRWWPAAVDAWRGALNERLDHLAPDGPVG